MDETLDKTTLATISLLEARLLRIEHILFGATTPPSRPAALPAIATLSDLERRFAHLLSRFRVYAELLKIYNNHPTLFSPTPAPDASLPPTQLSTPALRSTVLSFATSYPATASALTAATSESDSPVPDAAASAALVSLVPRMKGVEAVQIAQESEIAALRVRSERVLRSWYEERVLKYGDWVADVEARVEGVEAGVRRAARRRQTQLEI
ncbi:hypothetical protein CONLIGDRAFT_643288 [Coniochaeta ligniaria NRRL 30616]|uniref:Nuclear distribution protein n=1 Tax=Coniochaeta ligniaria NRRL 30616 TaxID=1408157 RepID=A0A1J7IUX3_9PEZI|nr:hypothetical protein CONLIGDRAFT_643288 [Coniochaeta ligniaria NRRL 30616]